ncbi:ABC transporter substrate-binding protein [Shewanella nanhaiensis]|uniref:ABC transporter substrate-binding protein n=1 Tax=Shewanella nanhaiensis TaxID=2864872 RepID=A0ABS7E4R7_9GAMM|nr:ABC transporter substrate-binding protein [Shewanella nanhaiensis]
MRKTNIRFKRCCFLSLFYLSPLLAASDSSVIEVNINYLKLNQAKTPALSNVIEVARDSGERGAELAVNDSNTTGKFLKQHFELNYVEFDSAKALLARLSADVNAGQSYFILDVPAELLIKADEWAEDKQLLIFNVNEPSDLLRDKQCLSSTLHTVPSDAMRSDAIAQWLLSRRFNKVLLVSGKNKQDIALNHSFKRAAKRFGIKILGEKQWHFDTDLRRSAQQEIPLFTQTRDDYDVVYVADRTKDFAEYLPFNTYLPRPVVGSAGLEALAWHFTIEQWGAAQLQNRFRALAERNMNELDFSAYLAVRSVAEAVHQQKTASPLKIINYMKSDDFQLAAYKGRKLSYRHWSGQLRMPMALVQPHGVVSLSPQAGVLHPVTELDTLGFDRQESQCVGQKESI